MEETVDRIKIDEEEANFRDTTSGYIAQSDKGEIQEGDEGWVDGGSVFAFINGTESN